MKSRGPLVFAISLLLVSCDGPEHDLGDKFIMYKEEMGEPLSIGLDVGGGYQGLFDGDIVAYGHDARYITFKTRNGDCYYIEKAKVLKDPSEPSVRSKGPFKAGQFAELKKSLGLPALGKKP